MCNFDGYYSPSFTSLELGLGVGRDPDLEGPQYFHKVFTMSDEEVETDRFNEEGDEVRPMSNIVIEEPPTPMTATVRRMSSTLFTSFGSSRFNLSSRGGSSRDHSNNSENILINATVVEPVVEAESMGFCYTHGKIIAALSFVLMVGFVTFVALTYDRPDMWGNTLQPTSVPSSMPSMAPSFDPRPTLQIVQDRGSVRCGMHQSTTPGTFRYQLVCNTVLCTRHAYAFN